MIAYEAVPGEQVIVKGSPRPGDPLGAVPRPARARGVQFSRKLWMTTLPDTLFEGGYNAFATPERDR